VISVPMSVLFAAVAASVRLLPGTTTAAASASSWPKYLFLFRGALPDFRHEEVKAAAGTVGVDPSRISFEPASLGNAEHDDDLLQWISLPNEDSARAIASRSCMVRACFEVWAHASFEMQPATFDSTAATNCADERWQVLADAVQCVEDGEPGATAATARARMLSPLNDGSWRCDTFSIGWKKPRELKAKIALMEKFDALLQPLPGDVNLKNPEHIITLVEDCRGPPSDAAASASPADDDGGEFPIEGLEAPMADTGPPGGLDVRDHPVGAVRPPSQLFLGRQLGVGAASHLAQFALSRRPYLGRTTLPPAFAMLMANQARVTEGSLVLDPFCGTGSTLLSCATRGARTVGVEIDERVLSGGDGGRGILINFETAGLPVPERLVLGDASRLDTPDVLPPLDAATGQPTPHATFDAIVTDPPYGLMEGLGTYYMPLHERLGALLRLAARRLRVGGRLVFLLPLPASAPALDALQPNGVVPPTSRCLELETICRHVVSLRMHRLMVTMHKVAEPTTEEEGWLPPEWAGIDRLGEALVVSEAVEGADGAAPTVPKPRRAGHGGDAAGSGAAVAPWDAWWEDMDEAVSSSRTPGEASGSTSDTDCPSD
jgi:SAM-dependent methyltransferase